MITIEGLYGTPESCQRCALSYINRYDTPCCAAHSVEYTINPEEYKTRRMRSCPLKSSERNKTSTYAGMIQAIESDFSLAADPESGHGLDELQLKIEQGDERLLKDIELLKALSFGIRYGRLRIIEAEEARSYEK